MNSKIMIVLVALISSMQPVVASDNLPAYSEVVAVNGETQVSTTTELIVPAKRSFMRNLWHNKGTYAFLTTQLAGLAGVTAFCTSDNNTIVRWTTGILAGLLYGKCVAKPFYNSFVSGRALEDEAETMRQSKSLNTTNWTEKNSFEIDGLTYCYGWHLWDSYNGYLRPEDKRSFVQKFLNIVMVDSEVSTRRTITKAIEDIKVQLKECSDSSSEYYTNAGLLLGRYLYRLENSKKPLPANIQNWIWESDKAGKFLKQPLKLKNSLFDGCYLEVLLDVEHELGQAFLESIDVLEQDFFANVFSLTEYRASLCGCHFTWYRCSSWARHGATVRYLALLRQYFFLLGCRALFDQMVTDGVVGSVGAGRW